MLRNVQQKISCAFETVIEPSHSTKRTGQLFSVRALGQLRNEFTDVLKEPHVISEKIDGTSTLIREFNGKPWLWARHDRKLAKKIQKPHKNTTIDKTEFKIENYKEAPDNWISSDECFNESGTYKPDINGHIMGWIPINPHSRQHCWHSQAVDLDSGLALTLKPHEDKSNSQLVLSLEHLKSLEGCTMELIGTNINGNAYNIGNKKAPLHFLIRHGVIPIVKNIPEISFTPLYDWFACEQDGRIEGIVWHCSNKKMYKIHRHHLNLDWPIKDTKLSKRPANVDIQMPEGVLNPSFKLLSSFNGRSFNTLDELTQCCVDNFHIC